MTDDEIKRLNAEYKRDREKACKDLQIPHAVFDGLVNQRIIIGSALWAELTDEEKNTLILTAARLAEDGHE